MSTDTKPADAGFCIGSALWPGLSKLVEEAGEVQQVAGKLIATGGKAEHWDGTNLHERLAEELADLMAACGFVARANGLDTDAFFARAEEKLALFHQWHGEQKS